ncbi:MAG: hypothetical protein ACRENB_01140 [Gemmatimonadales bacterium]
MLDRLAAAGVDVNVSVKPTQMGLDVDEALCERNLRAIVERAERVDRLIARRARVRLSKGAYREPPEVAFPDKRDVDGST